MAVTVAGQNPGMDAEIFDAFIDQLKRYVRERLIPAEEAVIAADRVPDDILDEMRAMGACSISRTDPTDPTDPTDWPEQPQAARARSPRDESLGGGRGLLVGGESSLQRLQALALHNIQPFGKAVGNRHQLLDHIHITLFSIAQG